MVKEIVIDLVPKQLLELNPNAKCTSQSKYLHRAEIFNWSTCDWEIVFLKAEPQYSLIFQHVLGLLGSLKINYECGNFECLH